METKLFTMPLCHLSVGVALQQGQQTVLETAQKHMLSLGFVQLPSQGEQADTINDTYWDSNHLFLTTNTRWVELARGCSWLPSVPARHLQLCLSPVEAPLMPILVS